ncbi:prolyl oligopeptidase family serine peptidase [Dietzia sp.]|uniref:prolyl oligopeptidase family serine peptidase n=1 Tax=Dietzia sp. TaxID=1871616 RepID=UPI002FDAA3B8
MTTSRDPHLWLEDVDSAAALAFVRDRSDRTLAAAESDPGFLELESEARAILDSADRIPWATLRGDWAYNFWRDAEHPRGVWRRMPSHLYMTAEGPDPASPHWVELLDVDRLAAEEDVNWVYKGTTVLRDVVGGESRALCQLSRGGADAVVVREFDLDAGRLIPASESGFVLEEAKTDVTWVDADTVAVVSALGEGQATDSGYGRTVRVWRRGTPFDTAAEEVWEGRRRDVAVGFSRDPGTGREIASRALDFYASTYAARMPGSGKWHHLPLPEDCRLLALPDHAVLLPRTDMEIGGVTIPAGGIGAAAWDELLGDSPAATLLWAPSASQALEDVTATRGALLCTVLDDVASSLFWLAPDTGTSTPVAGVPENSEVSVVAADRLTSGAAILSVSSPVTPPSSVLIHEPGGPAPQRLAAMPERFDAEGVEVEQYFATSEDGTKVPYFVMRPGGPEGAARTEPSPTILYGYGGFEIAMTPSYAALRGKLWVERGGTYVVAGIRGGGEYGPGWHTAALREKRLRAYEDFAAVARDLVGRGITTPEQLGAYGGSNGGLLMGVMATRYPELFGAIVCAVPLLDMRRYHLLLAGASWVAEYGDPDVPGDWEFLSEYSPYQNVVATAERRYPPLFVTTSTRDDRVHPGHARKFVAALEEAGQDVTYFENTEGGHAGAANNAQEARKNALLYWFFARELGL